MVSQPIQQQQANAAFLAPNLLAAAFPATRRRQISIRAQEAKERADAKRATAAAEAARLVTWQGKAKSYSFKRVSAADRDLLAAGPAVLLAKRTTTGFIVGIETFEMEDRARLAAWIDRSAVVSGIELHAYFSAGSRIERAAVVSDLARQPVRPSRFIVGGKFDLRAIMTAAHAAARAAQRSTGAVWSACFSAALSEVWQAAKAARAALAN